MSRARLGLYVFARVSLFSNCFELTPAFNRVFIDNSLTINPYSTNHILQQSTNIVIVFIFVVNKV